MHDHQSGALFVKKEKSGSTTALTEEIRYSKKLTSTEKILFAEISGLYKKQKKCWATNAYFAKKFDLSIKTISRCISKLEKLGLITVQIDQEAGNKRLIFLADLTPKTSIPMDKNEDTSGQKSLQEGDSLLIYKKNNKTKVEGEGHSPSDFIFENFKKLNSGSSIPKVSQIEQYIISLEHSWLKKDTGKEAQAFFDYYSATGWLIKGNLIVDWKAAVRNWINKSQNFTKINHAHSFSTQPSNFKLGHANRLSQDKTKRYDATF